MKQLLLFLTIFPLITYGQNTDTTKNISLGLSFSPDYGYRTLKFDASSQWLADLYDSIEIPKIGFTTGFKINFNFSKRTGLETGLLYSKKEYKTKEINLPEMSSIDFIGKAIIIDSYDYIDIPVQINYSLSLKKINVFLAVGVSPNIFVIQHEKTMSKFNDGHTTTKTISNSVKNGFRRINLDLLAGLGISYDINDKIFLKVEPTYRHSITSISRCYKIYLYSTGLDIGFYYNL